MHSRMGQRDRGDGYAENAVEGVSVIKQLLGAK